MAINLANKYSGKLVQVYNLASVLTGKTNTDYEWNGVNSITVLTAVTQPLNDYDATATGNRYGTPSEVQDTKQDMPITQDKSFSMTVDRKNYDDQMFAKKTGEVTRAEIGEQVVPFFDKYALTKWATNAGVTKTLTAAPDKDSVLKMFIDARKSFVNNKFPMSTGKNYAYVTSTTYSALLENPQFISVEKLGAKHLTNGVVGKCMNFIVVEVPDDYLPNKCHALFTHKESVIVAEKLNELKIHNDAPGISGALMEGRYRGDAFVLTTLNKGVYKAVTA